MIFRVLKTYPQFWIFLENLGAGVSGKGGFQRHISRSVGVCRYATPGSLCFCEGQVCLCETLLCRQLR